MAEQRVPESSGAAATVLTDSPVSPSSVADTHRLLRPATVFAERYRILRLLGEGGMGAVYEAEDIKLSRLVALKVIRSEMAHDRQAMKRFKQELVLARDVTHRNVVRLYDLGAAGDIDFISMEFIDGEDLCTILDSQKKLAPDAAAKIISQLCSGLEAVHAQGIIHRDVKPGNIMRDRSGRVVLMDFGLARSQETQSMTQSAGLAGTVEYMSPEQAKGEHLDARSDLFTVGLIFYELLTGVRPYRADSAIASLVKRTQERAQPARNCDSGIPTALSEICSKCLEISPKDRYQSATELLAELDAYTAGTKRSNVRAAMRVASRTLARTRIAWRGTAMVALLIAAVSIFTILLVRRPPANTSAHSPVGVLVADFSNHTGDPVFDGTLEPMFNTALEGATFINAFSRGQARKLAGKLPNPTDKLDEQSARLVAISQGLGAVVTGSISHRGTGYKLSVEALDARGGNTLATADVLVSNKEDVLKSIPKLVAPIRQALGDKTPESVQLAQIGGVFTAASLEAVHLDALGVEQQFEGKFEDALHTYAKAIEVDPNNGSAYAAMAIMVANMGKHKDAEKYIDLAMQHEDRMSERERLRQRGMFYFISSDWQKCVDEYSQLLDRYPGDRMSPLNLSTCYGQLRNLPKAVAAARRSVELVPKGVLQRVNLSFFSSFSGDFRTGEQQARAALELNPSAEIPYISLGEAELGQGQLAQAAETFRQLQKVSGMGASLAASSLGDLALYEGRFKDAIKIFEEGAAADLAAGNPDAAANKFAALAYAHWCKQEKAAAIAAAEKALANSQAVSIRFLAARIFADAGETQRAQKLAVTLGSELQAEPQAYAKIVQGKLALRRGDAPGAIKALTEANGLLDTWIGRFELGHAYLQAGAFVQAESEFDQCVRRRGEALEFFEDDMLTYGYFPPVHYYQGRAREGLKSPEFASSYRSYLSIREPAGEDPLIPEVRRRLPAAPNTTRTPTSLTSSSQ